MTSGPTSPTPAGFDAPWQARVFAIAEQLRRDGRLDWTDFQERLARHAPDGTAPDYEHWLTELERLDPPEHA